MASTLSIMSATGMLAASSGSGMHKKSSLSASQLSSFASLSSGPLSGRRRSLCLQKTYNSKIRSMAKELYFNKDGSAIKKLQVSALDD